MRFENPYFNNPKAKPHFKGSVKQWFLHHDGWAYVGSTILLLGLVWYGLMTQRWLWIDDITVTGNQYLTTEQVTDAAKQALAKKRWWIFPEQLYPFTNTSILEQDITASLTQSLALEHLTVTKHFPHGIAVDLAERVPGYVYFLNNQSYYLDTTGVVTAQVQPDQLDGHFPHLRDHNDKRTVTVGEQIFKPSVLDFIGQLHDKFTEAAHLNISEYTINQVSCQQKQYVAEKIFADEIQGSTSAETKKQKQAILERLQNKEITVDQSLDLLAQVKQSERTGTNTNTTANSNADSNPAYIQWQAQYVDSNCDYLAVVQDIGVVTQEGVTVYFDSTLPLDQQLNNLVTITNDEVHDPSKVGYIDVRFLDRAYYK